MTARPGLSGDLWGGLASMLVALPSALAFGVLVFTAIGPDQAAAGAIYGALGAAVLGLVAPVVGRNGGFITAPCAPAAAVMSGLAAHLAAQGDVPAERIVALMALAALLAGAMQVVYGVLRLGRLIKYIPFQVVTGYLSGVAVIIALGQLPKLLGLPSEVALLDGLISPASWRWEGLVVGAVTIVVTAVSPRLTTRVPAAILGLLAGIGTYFSLSAWQPALLVLDGNSLVIGPILTAGSPLDVMVGHARSLTALTPGDIGVVVATSATLSALLSIDTLKTGVVLDALTRRRHDSNRELVAQGVSNALAALTGGMAGAGTMGPTLVNVTSGGRSPLSGFAEGAFVVGGLLLLGPLVAWVPIGALAGLLLVVASRMFDWSALGLLRHPGTRLDWVVIATVVAVAASVGLIQAAVCGVALAILLFIRDQVSGSVIARQGDLRVARSTTRRLGAARALLDEHGGEGLVVELQGNLFFGTVDQLFTELMHDLQTRRHVLLDLRRVTSMDYTAGHLFHQMHDQLAERGGRLLFSGMPSRLLRRQDIQRYLTELGLLAGDDGVRVAETRNEALEWMEEQVLGAHGWVDHPEDAPLELGEIELFREFDEDALATLRAVVRPIHLEAGQQLFARGDEGDELFLIRRGAVDILLPLAEGKRHHLATMARGDYFGELAFLDQGARSTDGEAKQETELYALSRARFNEVARRDVVVGVKVFARLALLVSRRLRSADAELRALEQR